MVPAIISQCMWMVTQNMNKENLSLDESYALLSSMLFLVVLVSGIGKGETN